MACWFNLLSSQTFPQMRFLMVQFCLLKLICDEILPVCVCVRACVFGVCERDRVGFGVCTRRHLVPSIIDGQGQRACRSYSTQPECDKATQSDRATRRFFTHIYIRHTLHTFPYFWDRRVVAGNGGKIGGGEEGAAGMKRKKFGEIYCHSIPGS